MISNTDQFEQPGVATWLAAGCPVGSASPVWAQLPDVRPVRTLIEALAEMLIAPSPVGLIVHRPSIGDEFHPFLACLSETSMLAQLILFGPATIGNRRDLDLPRPIGARGPIPLMIVDTFDELRAAMAMHPRLAEPAMRCTAPTSPTIDDRDASTGVIPADMLTESLTIDESTSPTTDDEFVSSQDEPTFSLDASQPTVDHATISIDAADDIHDTVDDELLGYDGTTPITITDVERRLLAELADTEFTDDELEESADSQSPMADDVASPMSIAPAPAIVPPASPRIDSEPTFAQFKKFKLHPAPEPSHIDEPTNDLPTDIDTVAPTKNDTTASTSAWPTSSPTTDPRVERFSPPKETRGLRLDVWVDDPIKLPVDRADTANEETLPTPNETHWLNGAASTQNLSDATSRSDDEKKLSDDDSDTDDDTIGPSLGTLVKGWLDDRRTSDLPTDMPTLPATRPTRIPPGARIRPNETASPTPPLKPAELTDEELRALLGDDGNDDDHGPGRKK